MSEGGKGGKEGREVMGLITHLAFHFQFSLLLCFPPSLLLPLSPLSSPSYSLSPSLSPPPPSPFLILPHPRLDYMFWIDTAHPHIMRARLNGSELTTLVTGDLSDPSTYIMCETSSTADWQLLYCCFVLDKPHPFDHTHMY